LKTFLFIKMPFPSWSNGR